MRFCNPLYNTFNKESPFQGYNINLVTSKLRKLENLSNNEQNIESYWFIAIYVWSSFECYNELRLRKPLPLIMLLLNRSKTI